MREPIIDAIKDFRETEFLAYCVMKGMESGLINQENKSEIFSEFENIVQFVSNIYAVERDTCDSEKCEIAIRIMFEFAKKMNVSVGTDNLPQVLDAGYDYYENGQFFPIE